MKIQKTNTSKIPGLVRPQYSVTIPTKLIQAMGWKKGDNVDFEVIGRDKLKMERAKNRAPGKQGGLLYEQGN